MLEYFAKAHRAIVYDVSTLISEGFSVSQSKNKYDQERIDKMLNKVASITRHARNNVLDASVAIDQSAGPNKFTAILTDVSGLLYRQEAALLVEPSGVEGSAQQVLSCFHRALEETVSLLYDTAFKSQIDQSTFVDVSGKLEIASSQIACASILVRDYLAAQTEQEKSSNSLSNVVDGIRRATYITTCSLMNIYKQHRRFSNRTNLVDVIVSPNAIHSAVLIADLISLKTPSHLRACAAEITLKKFRVIKEHCSTLPRLNHSNTYDDVSGTLDSALSIILELATEYSGKSSAAKSAEKSPSKGAPSCTPLKMLELLLHEGMYHSNYAIHLYNSSKNHKAHSDQTKAKILANLEEIKDSFRKCVDSFALVLKTAQTTKAKSFSDSVGTDSINTMKSLQSIVGTTELLYDVAKLNSLTGNTSRFIDATVICALRSLDIALEAQTSYKCVWDTGTLPAFPEESPKALNWKDKANNKKIKTLHDLVGHDEFRFKISKQIEKLEAQTSTTLRRNKPEVDSNTVVKQEGNPSNANHIADTKTRDPQYTKVRKNLQASKAQEMSKTFNLPASEAQELSKTFGISDCDLDSPDSSLEEPIYASIDDLQALGGGERGHENALVTPSILQLPTRRYLPVEGIMPSISNTTFCIVKSLRS